MRSVSHGDSNEYGKKSSRPLLGDGQPYADAIKSLAGRHTSPDRIQKMIITAKTGESTKLPSLACKSKQSFDLPVTLAKLKPT
jgi:hypothetical protein